MEQQLIKFTRHLESLKDDKGKRSLSTWSIKGFQTAVQSFFSHNGCKLIFARKELDIEPAERETVVKEWIPSNEEVRMIYRACKSARDRSILLTLYQSGFSETDVSNMRIEDSQFYDQNGNWQCEPYTDVYHARLREKTNILQQTCISREAIEDIRIMLQNRGFPKKGWLFESRKGERLTVRGINDMLKPIVKHHLSYKQAEWKTKHLRDSYMNGLLQAKITQEVKDAMVGHKRKGARSSYGLTEQTIKQAYDSAFKFLSVNGVGSSTRKIEQIDQTTQHLAKQIAKLTEQNEQLEKALDLDVGCCIYYLNGELKVYCIPLFRTRHLSMPYREPVKPKKKGILERIIIGLSGHEDLDDTEDEDLLLWEEFEDEEDDLE